MKVLTAVLLSLSSSLAHGQTCGGGNVGNGICADASLCCSQWGWCGTSSAHCTAPAPTAPSPSPPTTTTGGSTTAQDDSRMIAYVANWMDCPTASQLQQYTHVVVAFAVSYTWAPTKNNCDTSCNISTPPVCTNMDASTFIQEMHSAGKQVILSFGGAGMGGSWAGDVNDCWEYCFGKETHVVNQLTSIVQSYNYDGVDIDYEYFYESNAAQIFLKQVTTGLRNALPGKIVTHAPMDADLLPGTEYFSLLQEVAWALDFLMPQYYNGVTRPAIDGVSGTGSGSVAAIDHYSGLVDLIFSGDATKVVFGFCINDCSATGSNANGSQAASVMSALSVSYPCNGGAFFWVAHDDAGGAWSSTVNGAVQTNAGCSSGGSNPTPSTPSQPTPTPPTVVGTCGGGNVGNGLCPDSSLCCSSYGWCGTSSAHCGPSPAPPSPSPPTMAGTCGGGSVGNGVCADPNLCCSNWGWCGSTSAHCG